MEIKLYNQNSVVPLSSNDMMIVEAIKSPLVNNVSDQDLKSKLLLVVASSFLTAGFKAPESELELNIILNEIIAEQRRNKTNLRIDEIEIAFKNGVHKKYGDYFGLNAVSFCMFIREYVKEESRLEAIRLKNMPEPKKEPTEQEIKQLSINNAITAFNELKSKGTVGRFGVVVYDFLEKEKILILDVPTKKDYWESAKVELSSYLEGRLIDCADRGERNQVKLQLQSLIDSEFNQTTDQKLKTISKRLAVDDFFRSLEMDGSTVEELF